MEEYQRKRNPENSDVIIWFKERYKSGTQVHVREGTLWRDSTVNRQFTRIEDGTSTFHLFIPDTRGIEREYISDRPDYFEGITLAE